MLSRMRARRLRGAPRGRAGGDAGFTLIELLVAMSIFSVILAISLVGLRSLTQATIRANGLSEARAKADRVYTRLDKIVPYASAINAAGSAGTKTWVEIQTSVPAGGESGARCWQLRLDSSTGLLQLRSWQPGNGSTVTAWSTLATDVRARTGTGAPAPFTLTVADTTYTRQRLTIALDVTTPLRNSAAATDLAPRFPVDTTYTARNTDTKTSTNGTGMVCQEVSRS